MTKHFTTDEEAWVGCHPLHRWVFNKLEVAKRDHKIACNPREIPVPREGWYVVRPIYNLSGMGIGAEKMYLTPETTERDVYLGYFWAEYIEGRHLSVDYRGITPILTVEGFKDIDTMYRWDKWRRIDNSEAPPLPKWLEDVAVYYPVINVEYIDGKVIEVHLRGNPDFQSDDVKEVIPVWEGNKIVSKHFHADTEDYPYKKREGFIEVR